MARREYACLELERVLVSKSVEPELANTVIAHLLSRDLISDHRFTEAFIYSRQQRCYGPIRIKAELRQRGVGDDLIAQSIHLDDSIWQERLSHVWQQKYHGQQPASYPEWAKQAKHLQYRGYTLDQINQVVKRP